MMYFLRWQAPWLLMMLFIFVMSSIPDLTQPVLVFDYSDKLIHFVVFGILGVLMARGFARSGNVFIRQHYVLTSIVFAVLFALTDEWHQSFVPGRTADWLDWLADTLGILIFIVLYNRFHLKSTNQYG
ncbi:MAG TPA: VanZ family protein [Caldithrix abyssi]|uniref:VanZ family protein n=1 Tax=Caldithrix abyssi TaxID=187145 RepID=A0A7V4WX04_CALAY|nr:VanZ family protein [Caldithrix abyssi]